MQIIVQVVTVFVALLHLYFLYFEMFAWETKGPAIFRSFPKSLFPPTKAMAANQGLYNGFLAAGLIWSLLISDPVWRDNVAIFFLGCVIVAGVYGGITVARKIFFVQALPAILGVILVMAG